jgi:hypothetical protein
LLLQVIKAPIIKEKCGKVVLGSFPKTNSQAKNWCFVNEIKRPINFGATNGTPPYHKVSLFPLSLGLNNLDLELGGCLM